jgi:outer membrane lipoprotein-sorting protein
MRIYRTLLCLLLAGSTLPAVSVRGDEIENIRAIAARLNDMQATAEARDINAQEFTRLKKQAQALQFKRIEFYYKGPDKYRVDSRGRELVRVSMIQNGDHETWRTSLGLRKSQSLVGKAAKKQDTLDFGMLSPPLWGMYRIQPLGDETIEGTPCVALKMTLIEDPGHGHYRVWLDAKTYRVVGWERYGGGGELKLRYMFREPERSPDGVWYSRRIELYSPEGHFVGALVLTQVKINQGLSDKLFD